MEPSTLAEAHGGAESSLFLSGPASSLSLGLGYSPEPSWLLLGEDPGKAGNFCAGVF